MTFVTLSETGRCSEVCLSLQKTHQVLLNFVSNPSGHYMVITLLTRHGSKRIQAITLHNGASMLHINSLTVRSIIHFQTLVVYLYGVMLVAPRKPSAIDTMMKMLILLNAMFCS